MAWLKEPIGAVAIASLHKAIVTAYGLESRWSINDQDETLVKLNGGLSQLMSKNQQMSCG